MPEKGKPAKNESSRTRPEKRERLLKIAYAKQIRLLSLLLLHI
jgi:hypothetical protein